MDKTVIGTQNKIFKHNSRDQREKDEETNYHTRIMMVLIGRTGRRETREFGEKEHKCSSTLSSLVSIPSSYFFLTIDDVRVISYYCHESLHTIWRESDTILPDK